MKKNVIKRNIKIVSRGHQEKIFGGDIDPPGCACCICKPSTPNAGAGDITATK